MGAPAESKPVDSSLFDEGVLLAPEAGDGRVESIDPKRPGNVPAIGDRELASKVTEEWTIWGRPLIFKPDSSSGTGVGGVGVLGGAGMGRLEAMTATTEDLQASKEIRTCIIKGHAVSALLPLC